MNNKIKTQKEATELSKKDLTAITLSLAQRYIRAANNREDLDPEWDEIYGNLAHSFIRLYFQLRGVIVERHEILLKVVQDEEE